ncbi:MAG: glycerol-3-phosphate 1-O-acyltransferase PlsY [Pseudomonadota bacterium]
MTDPGTIPPLSYWIPFPVGAYMLCSIPFGRLISKKVAGIDITRRGSGNIGATNVARELGLRWGVFTLFLDMIKGFIPVFFFHLFFPHFDLGMAIVSLSAISGHQFSLFQKFKGGKGVATALGAYLVISPPSSLMAILLFILIVSISDFVSLGSIVSALIMPLLLGLFGKSEILIVASLMAAILICFKHKDNIKALLKGKERRWRKKGLRSKNQ